MGLQGHRVVTIALKVGTMTCGIGLILVYIATFTDWVPVLSSVANYATVAFASIMLPCVIGVVAFCVSIAVWQRKSRFFRIAGALNVIALIMAIATTGIVASGVEAHGAKIKLLDVYSVSEPDGVFTRDFVYDKENEVELTLFSDMDVMFEALGISEKVSQSGKKSLVLDEDLSFEERFAQLSSEDLRPIVVYIHGGGWIENDRYFRIHQCKTFAKQGYLSMSLDYTLSTEDRHMAVDCAAEKQLLKAFAWIKTFAPLFGGDVSRLYVMGDSAGGNLALDIAYKINGGTYTEADGVELPKITAVSVIYPVAYPGVFYDNDDLVFGVEAKKMSELYTGGSPEELPEVYADITPANFLTADAPPTFIMVGEHDTLVPPLSSYELAAELEEAGIEYELVTVPFANHTMDIPTGNTVCQAYGQLARGWFEQHGANADSSDADGVEQ